MVAIPIQYKLCYTKQFKLVNNLNIAIEDKRFFDHSVYLKSVACVKEHTFVSSNNEYIIVNYVVCLNMCVKNECCRHNAVTKNSLFSFSIGPKFLCFYHVKFKSFLELTKFGENNVNTQTRISQLKKQHLQSQKYKNKQFP